MNPLKNANRPIRNSKYLVGLRTFKAIGRLLLKRTKYVPNRNKRNPWNMSPNITANKKGKVIIVNNPGFTSLYLGTP